MSVSFQTRRLRLTQATTAFAPASMDDGSDSRPATMAVERAGRRGDDTIVLTVSRGDDGERLGWLCLFRDAEEPGRAHVGYGLRCAHWGHGYATEAVGALLTLAFEHFGFDAIEADVPVGNRTSLAVFDRLGVPSTGLRRHASAQYGLTLCDHFELDRQDFSQDLSHDLASTSAA